MTEELEEKHGIEGLKALAQDLDDWIELPSKYTLGGVNKTNPFIWRSVASEIRRCTRDIELMQRIGEREKSIMRLLWELKMAINPDIRDEKTALLRAIAIIRTLSRWTVADSDGKTVFPGDDVYSITGGPVGVLEVWKTDTKSGMVSVRTSYGEFQTLHAQALTHNLEDVMRGGKQ